MTDRASDRRLAFTLVAVAVLAVFLRSYALGAHSLWFDEALEYTRSAGNLADAVVGRSIDQDPPLFAMLTWAWLRLGDGEAWLRLPSVVFGVLAVVLSGYWSSRQFGHRTGALTALFMALSPVLVHYSQELNQYSAMVLLAVALIVAYERLLRRRRALDWWVLAATSVVALATHFGLAFFIAAIVLDLLRRAQLDCEPQCRRRLAAYAGLLVFTTIGLWWLGLGNGLAVPHLDRRLGGTHLQKELDYITDVGWREILVFYTVPFSGGPALHIARAMAVAGAIGAAVLWRAKAAGRRVVVTYFFLPLTLTYLASLMGWYPLGFRYGLFTVPALMVAMAAAVDAAWQRWPLAGATLALAGAVSMLAFSTHTDAVNDWIAVPREELRQVTAYVAEREVPGDLVYVYYGAGPAYEYYGRMLHSPTLQGRSLDAVSFADEAARIAAASAEGNGRVWLVMSHIAPGDDSGLLTAVRKTEVGGGASAQVLDVVRADNAAAFLARWPREPD